MESFATLIKSRKSTRKFTDQLLNPEQVEMILKAALMAPASKRKNPWQFVVVEDKEMLAKLSVCKPAGAAFLKDCALAVVVLANVMESDVWVEDASIASIYMQLQAEDLGLGSCWMPNTQPADGRRYGRRAVCARTSRCTLPTGRFVHHRYRI